MVGSNRVDEIKEIVATAQSAVSEVKDTDLRLAAFNRVLDHLLTGEPAKEQRTGAKRRRTAAGEKENDERKKRIGTGPKARLEALIEEGFFSEPRASRSILEALAERGHHMQQSDLNRPLPALVQEQKLRRKRMAPPDGGKQIWHYSNW